MRQKRMLLVMKTKTDQDADFAGLQEHNQKTPYFQAVNVQVLLAIFISTASRIGLM